MSLVDGPERRRQPTASVTSLPGWVRPAMTRPPTPLTPLVGNAAVLAAAHDLLVRPEVRLVTLTGPGGIGKTRLALELAGTLAASFSDVAWVPLDAIHDSAAVLPAVARALGGVPSPSAFDAARAAVGEARVLLVIDNLEQVIEAAPDLASLLGACPSLTMLATSRTLLRVRGEHVVTVAPLDVPEASASKHTVAASAAVQLFVERAGEVAPTFDRSDETLPVVADVCRLLDGIPLAIELTAARLNVLPVSRLRDRLVSRQPLPLSRTRDLPARHRTMADTIGWSYDLLSSGEQDLFRRLSVFSGGATLEAVEAVAGDEAIEHLAGLADKHLISFDKAIDGSPRYRMLVPVREYAAERLLASGDDEGARAAHAAYFMDFAERRAHADMAVEGRLVIVALEADHSNLGVALDWLHAKGDWTGVERLAVALGRFWAVRGHYEHARAWLERVVERDELAHGKGRVHALAHLGYITLLQGGTESAEAIFRACVGATSGSTDALATSYALVALGGMAMQRADYPAATSFLEQAAGRAGRVADRRLSAILEGRAKVNIATVATEQGDWSRASGLCDEAFRHFREAGYAQGIPYIYRNLGVLALSQGNLTDAHRHVREILEGDRVLGDPRLMIEAIELAALIAIESGQWESAGRWLGAADAERRRGGVALHLPTSEQRARTRARAALRVQLGEPGFTSAWDLGFATPFDRTIDEVLSHTVSAKIVPAIQVRLTKRERDVLTMLVGGLSNRAIGEALFIGERTVQSHLVRIYTKLGVRSRTAAIVAALSSGLAVSPADDR